MASEYLINKIKHQATRLQDGLNFFQITCKRTQALEFISRHIYGYTSWNNVSGNSVDLNLDLTFAGLHRQVAELCLAVPALSYQLHDLEFEEGVPRILKANQFRKGAIAIASIHTSGEPHIFMWEELLTDLFITDEMLSIYPPEILPDSRYGICNMFKMQIEHKDRNDTDWIYGNYPWDRWEQTMKKAGTYDAGLIQQIRDAFRECYQHSWDDELKLFCGYFDDAKQLTKLIDQHPVALGKAISYLMDHDGGHYNPQEEG